MASSSISYIEIFIFNKITVESVNQSLGDQKKIWVNKFSSGSQMYIAELSEGYKTGNNIAGFQHVFDYFAFRVKRKHFFISIITLENNDVKMFY